MVDFGRNLHDCVCFGGVFGDFRHGNVVVYVLRDFDVDLGFVCSMIH